MILNTLENLGKFEAKGDEGYLIGYSMSSKGFRVFNKRTRRVEENLHVEVLENKAIEKGAGLNWLFDIDSLTKSMNYVSVDACINSTDLSGTKDAASQEVKKDGIFFNSPVPTACFTDSSKPSSDTRLISKRVANQVETPSLDNILTLTNRFEDILGVTTNSDESSGVEADVSNMETTITASPAPTLRIHRDHPKSQIIGHVDTPIQTRNKSKESAFFYSTIDEEVHVMQPPGFQDPEFSAKVYKVEKAIEFEAFMYEKFQMSAMGELNFFLGLQVLQKEDGIFLTQDKYVGDILKKFGYSDVRSSNTPMDKENP
uniref:Retrotransposon protein, putative, unclassified n=1 Tax=Tanacetum cinerariifolium TaxID=118510 RepID=A0A699K3X7_TANCI|nr:retrotransposon protein, putative, unclassified [Tanacetum cinerariifolium]